MSHHEIVFTIQTCLPSTLKTYRDIESYLHLKYPIEFKRFFKTAKYVHYKQQVYIWLKNKAKKSASIIKRWFRSLRLRQKWFDIVNRLYLTSRTYENDTTLLCDNISDIKPSAFFQIQSVTGQWYAFDLSELFDVIDKRPFDLHTGKYTDVVNPYTRGLISNRLIHQIDRIRSSINTSKCVMNSDVMPPDNEPDKYKKYLSDVYKAHVRQLRSNLDMFAGCDIDVDHFTGLNYNETVELIINVRNNFRVIDTIVRYFPEMWKSFSKLYKRCIENSNNLDETNENETMMGKHYELVLKTVISFIQLLNCVLNKSHDKQEIAFMVFNVYKTIIVNRQSQQLENQEITQMLQTYNQSIPNTGTTQPQFIRIMFFNPSSSDQTPSSSDQIPSSSDQTNSNDETNEHDEPDSNS
jgi:hypothetical protein